MHAVRKLVAHQLSAGWRGWVVLALLVGLAGGAVLTATAGARRTASAYPRFLQVSRASDVLVAPAGTGIGGYYDALGRLPGVAALAPLAGLQAGPLSGGRPDLAKATVLAPLDGRAGHLVEIPKVLAGRLPLRDRPAEVAVDQVAAQALHLHVGSKLALAAVPGAGSPVGKRFRRLAEHVVGIIVTRGSVVAVNDQDKIPAILASPALFHQLGPRYRAFDGASVQLRLGTSADAFGRRALALARSFPRTGLGLSVMTVAAAFTFGASLLHLVHTPRQYGQTWDIAVDLQFGTVTPRRMAALLAHVPGISSWSYGNHGIISVDGAVVPAVGVAPGRGPLLSATLLDGRPPRSEHEIVLGTSVLRQIGRRVGQSVTVRVNDRRETARIVGRAVFPNFGQGSFTPTDLGQGAETAASLLPAGQSGGQGPPGFSIVLLRFEPGPRRAADIASFERALIAFCANVDQSTCVVRDQRPNGVTNYAPIDSTPELLAAVLAALGLAVLWQFAVLSGRRRRREFAILRAIGLLQRQVIFITAWQIMTIAGLAMAAGLPLGLAAGRWTWAWFASNLGISTGASIPSALLLYMVPTVFLVANAVAFWPARTVARLSPAAVLRAE